MAQSLQTLLEGIYSSILEARHHVNAQHLNLFNSYFEKKLIQDPATGADIEAYSPRLVAVATSEGVGDDEKHHIVETPVLTLIPLNSLSIDTLDIEFEAKLTNFSVDETEQDDAPDDDASRRTRADARTIISRTIGDLLGNAASINIMSKGKQFDSSASPAKVKVSFKMAEAPEGMNLIQEQLLDYVRQ